MASRFPLGTRVKVTGGTFKGRTGKVAGQVTGPSGRRSNIVRFGPKQETVKSNSQLQKVNGKAMKKKRPAKQKRC